GSSLMGFLNLIMGLVAAVLVATGIKNEDPEEKTNKQPNVEIVEPTKKIEPKLDFEILKNKSFLLLKSKYTEPKKITPKGLSELNYDKYKNIRFLPEQSLWRKEGSPFQLQFLHPGYIYNHDIIIYELIDNKYKIIPYNKSMFDFTALDFKEKLPDSFGYSGFKVHYPINTEEHTDEFLVFQGATYFRAVSANQQYGLSARGLATNTGMNYAEDFPVFKEFWVDKPSKNSDFITIYALMDGKSAVGAFQFKAYPGKTTMIHVKATITLRKKVDRLGIAPLTSMYWYGENSETPHYGSYPEVHDSDGLLILNGDKNWIWRPMANPKKPTVNSFHVDKLSGFGLLQRDREFSSYEDEEMNYHQRPGAWVVPVGDWGKGSVQTYRNPTKRDSDDNIGAFWVPDVSPEVGKPYDFEYKIYWIHENPLDLNLGRTIATRVKLNPDEPKNKLYQIDFKGERLDSIENLDDVEGVVTGSQNAEISDIQIIKIEESNKWRLSFKFKNKTPATPAELTAYLKSGDSILTENWTYTVE
ncbi:MAG: glucan biosynthesis protein, partial [Leptospiraceae bacterium]|nr:glucan biosynthesis protein [Leptospiraceae bacterium]